MSLQLRELCDGIPSADVALDALRSNEILQAIDLAMLDPTDLESLFADSTFLEAATILHRRASVHKKGWATTVCRFTQPTTPRPSSSGLRPTRTSVTPSSSSISTLTRSATSYTARCFLHARVKIAKKAKHEHLQAKKDMAMAAALV